MRKRFIVAFLLTMCSVVGGALPIVVKNIIAYAATAKTVAGLGPNTQVYWTGVSKDTTGATEAVVTYEVGIVTADKDLTVAGTLPLKTVSTSVTYLNLGSSIATLPAGTYRVFVRAVDGAGNRSGWSTEFLEGPLDVQPPQIPSGIGTKLNLVVKVLPPADPSTPTPLPVGTKMELAVQVVNP